MMRKPMPIVGPWGRVWMRSLLASQPETYQELEQSGRLEAEATEREEWAHSTYWSIVQEMEKKQPGHEQATHAMAREMVMEQLLTPRPDPEEAL